jgi:hypothetical protein
LLLEPMGKGGLTRTGNADEKMGGNGESHARCKSEGLLGLLEIDGSTIRKGQVG